MMSKTFKNHKIEIIESDKDIMIRPYYKDSNGFYQHLGDIVLSLDESIEFVREIRRVQEDMIANK